MPPTWFSQEGPVRPRKTHQKKGYPVPPQEDPKAAILDAAIQKAKEEIFGDEAPGHFSPDDPRWRKFIRRRNALIRQGGENPRKLLKDLKAGKIRRR